MKLLVLGDSYGLPRFEFNSFKVELKYIDTYPEVLRYFLNEYTHHDVIMVNHCQHGNTTHSLICKEANEILFLEPDFIIIQLGLADLWPCTERNLEPLQKELFGKDPWVNEQDFKENLERFIDCAKNFNSKVVLVNIPYLRRKKPIKESAALIYKRIISYNKILFDLAIKFDLTYIDLYSYIEDSEAKGDVIAKDGIHGTRATNQKLAVMIMRKIIMADERNVL